MFLDRTCHRHRIWRGICAGSRQRSEAFSLVRASEKGLPLNWKLVKNVFPFVKQTAWGRVMKCPGRGKIMMMSQERADGHSQINLSRMFAAGYCSQVTTLFQTFVLLITPCFTASKDWSLITVTFILLDKCMQKPPLKNTNCPYRNELSAEIVCKYSNIWTFEAKITTLSIIHV